MRSYFIISLALGSHCFHGLQLRQTQSTSRSTEFSFLPSQILRRLCALLDQFSFVSYKDIYHKLAAMFDLYDIDRVWRWNCLTATSKNQIASFVNFYRSPFGFASWPFLNLFLLQDTVVVPTKGVTSFIWLCIISQVLITLICWFTFSS